MIANMLAFLIDLFGGWWVAGNVEKWWKAVLLCIAIGVTAAVSMNLLISVLTEMDEKELMARIIIGSLAHPVVTLLAWGFWRWRNKRR